MRLNKFGDCEPALKDADFFLMEVSFKMWNEIDTGYNFQLYHGAIHIMESGAIVEKSRVGLKLMQALDSMKCGDDVTFILPFEEIDNSYISNFSETRTYALNQKIELHLSLSRTFTRELYLNYLQSMAQQKEINETDAIELFLANQNEHKFRKSGSCFLQNITSTKGDSVKAGREISIVYTTHLFNDTQLDSLTTMNFTFGKPGQVIDGLQYGLSQMCEGEHAKIYLPSQLAFGENGSSTGIVPRNTPVYFDVKVLDVKTSEESLKKTKHI